MPLLALCTCTAKPERPAPPRVTDTPHFPAQNSSLVVPVELSLDTIEQALEQGAPHRLWTIDQPGKTCLPGQRVKLFGERLKVTPDIKCRIVGQVTRGRIRVSGTGQRLSVSMPVKATVSARDVGGLLKGETATGAATVRADVRLAIDRNWNPTAKIDISYDWAEPPGIDFLGQRVRFVQRADRELARVLAGLERDVQRRIAAARIRPVLTEAWKTGFAVIELNRERPPAWMRVTPTGAGFLGYRVDGRLLKLTVAAEALTETFVGEKPAPPSPVPLPPQMGPVRDKGMRFFIPVLADCAELEPVVLRALRKLAAKGIRLEGVGHVDADFQKVTIYPTTGNRLAVGIDAVVEPVGDNFGTRFGKAHGRVWLTGAPVHEPDSQVIHVRNLEIFGGADRIATDLLIQLISNENVRAEIAGGLTEDFSRDFEKVVSAARRAIASRQEGDFHLSARIDQIHHDRIEVTGAGLFLPVIATGKAEIRFSPGKHQ
jgi:hypothetical protein